MSISDFPHEYALHAATILGNDLEVSVTVRQHGATLRAGSSTQAAASCDRVEALVDAGPCVEAMEDGEMHLVRDVEHETRWREWREQTVLEGFSSSAAVPAAVDESVAVALNLYSRSGDPWSDDLLAAAGSYAQLIASSVRLRFELADLEDAAAGFYRSMSDVVVVERAVGAIMQTNQCTEDEALHILRSASRHRKVSERDVAETILRALVVPGTDDGAGDAGNQTH